jgi:hypothetical protein
VCSQPGNKGRSTVSKHIVGTLRPIEKNPGCASPHLQSVSMCYDIIFHYSFKLNSLAVFCASWATFRGIILYSVYWTGQPCDTFPPFVMRNRAPGFFLIAYWLFHPTFQPNSLLLANIKSRGSLLYCLECWCRIYQAGTSNLTILLHSKKINSILCSWGRNATWTSQ